MSIIEKVLTEIKDRPADDIIIGPTFVAVKIGSRIGLAHRIDDGRESADNLKSKTKTKLAAFINSDNPLEAAVGAAAINAQLNPKNAKKCNIFKNILDIAPNYKTIGVVGKFPIIVQLEKLDSQIYAFEQKPIPGFLPAERTEDLLPKCDLSIITGTAFINKTLERLLELSRGHTMVIGPSSPMSPALFEFGVDIVAGVKAEDDKILEIIANGGGTKEFSKLVEMVYIEDHFFSET